MLGQPSSSKEWSSPILLSFGLTSSLVLSGGCGTLLSKFNLSMGTSL